MLESPKKKKKKKDRDREIGTIPQMSIVSPLLFQNTIEDSVPSNDVALEKRKQKKKKHKRDLSEAMEVMPEASEAEATEVGQKLSGEQEQGMERKKKSKKQHVEDYGVTGEGEGKEKKKKNKRQHEEEANVLEVLEQEEQVPHLMKKKKKKREQSASEHTEMSIQGERVDGGQDDAETHKEEGELPFEEKKRKKSRKVVSDQAELSIPDKIVAGEEETENEEVKIPFEGKKKKKKSRKVVSDQADLSIPDKIVAGEEETENEEVKIPFEGKKKKKKSRKVISDQADLNIPDKIVAGEEETENEEVKISFGGRKKKKKSKEINSDRTAVSTQGEIMAVIEEGIEATEQGDEVPKQVLQERKQKKNKKKAKKSSSDENELCIQGKIGTLSKSCGTENLVCKEELHDCTLDIGSELQELDSMYIEELKEFIPSVAQKSTDELHKLVKYDLPRFREFKKEGVCIKHGKYSKEELRRLEENVADFLVLTGIDSSAKLFFPSRFPEERAHIVKMKNIHKFHLRMSAGICRPWHDIYHKGRRYFDPNNRGRFTDDEIHSLQKLHTLYGNNWMKISELTGRSSHSLEKRFSQLCKLATQNKGPWTQTEQEDLERAIKDHLLRLAEPGSQGPMVNWDQLYNNLPWAEVAKKVGTRSWDQCRVKWMALLKKKMTSGTQVGRGEKSLETNIKLIKALYAMEIEDVADVNWEDLTQNIGDVTPYYLQTKFYRLKATWVPRWQNKSFGDIIDFLYENILPQLEQKLHSNHDRSAEEIENIGTAQESFLVFHV